MSAARRALGLYLLFAVAALALFAPSLDGAFIMDDWGYITKNLAVTTTSSPLLFWTTLNQPDFWPLSYSYYWLAYHFFGENPYPYHVVNVLLHALNALLVLQLGRAMQLRWAVAAALLFLIHPLHVQAVSWIIQFKTLLCTTLALLSVLAYDRYSKGGEARFLIAAFAAFGLSLLAKSAALFLPVLFLMWPSPSNRTRRHLIAFFALSLLSGAITLYVNALNFTDTSAAVFHLSWAQRLLLSAQSLMHFLYLSVFPYPLSFMYPAGVPEAGDLRTWLNVAGVAVLLFLASRLSPKPRRAAAGYFLLLAPALGFASIPHMKLSLTTDHWAYLPDAFLVLIPAALLESLPVRAVRWAVAIAALPLALVTFQHARTFQSEETFWLHTRTTNPAHAAPAYNLGVIYDQQGRVAEAIEQYERAITMDPQHSRAWYNLGRLHALSGQLPQARESFEKAVALNLGADAHLALARTLAQSGDKTAAIQTLVKAVQLYPGNAELSAWLSSLLQP